MIIIPQAIKKKIATIMYKDLIALVFTQMVIKQKTIKANKTTKKMVYGKKSNFESPSRLYPGIMFLIFLIPQIQTNDKLNMEMHKKQITNYQVLKDYDNQKVQQHQYNKAKIKPNPKMAMYHSLAFKKS